MLCCASSCLWRSPALVAALVLVVMASCFAAVGAQPAAHRSEATVNAADNGLRRSHSPRQRHRVLDTPRFLCGKDLHRALEEACEGRGYYSPKGGRMSGGDRSDGPATRCCQEGCTRKYLDSFCAAPAINLSEASESVEQVRVSVSGERESVSHEVIITETSRNEVQTRPLEKEPKSDNTVEAAETENAIFREVKLHKTFFVKTNNYHQVNSPVTTRRQTTIR